MKNISFLKLLSYFSLLLSFAFFISCSKENIHEDTLQLSDFFSFKSTNSLTEDEGPDYPTKFYYDHGDVLGWGCWEGGNNCFDEVVITGKKKQEIVQGVSDDGEITNFLNDINNKKSGLTILQNNKNILLPIVGEKAYEAIVSERLTVEFKGNELENKGVYMVMKHKNKVFAAIPLKKSVTISKSKVH
jgi:hypothetical protein